MDDAERKRIEAEFLAGVVGELENNPDFERQYREMVPELRERMTAILDRFKEPRDTVEEDIVYLATRELAFLSSPQFRDDVIANRTN